MAARLHGRHCAEHVLDHVIPARTVTDLIIIRFLPPWIQLRPDNGTGTIGICLLYLECKRIAAARF